MTDFPWDVSIGLGLVLLGTLWVIVYILRLDSIEDEINRSADNHNSETHHE